jgi:signal peptidase I
MRLAIKITYGLFTFLLLIIALAVIGSYFNINGYKIYTVQSGSMEPAIQTGSVVIDHQSDIYEKGDVVSFSPNKDPKNIVTHRILASKTENGITYFATKGDANSTPDIDVIQSSMILGKVILSIPLLGYPIAFARTQTGLILLIIIPATIIVYSELVNIKNEIAKSLAERRKKKLAQNEK